MPALAHPAIPTSGDPPQATVGVVTGSTIVASTGLHLPFNPLKVQPDTVAAGGGGGGSDETVGYATGS